MITKTRKKFILALYMVRVRLTLFMLKDFNINSQQTFRNRQTNDYLVAILRAAPAGSAPPL